MNLRLLILVSLLTLLFSCSRKSSQTLNPSSSDNLNEVVKLMSGTFSSAEQAKNDTAFYDINLVMFPIWENEGSSKWLYVEQAVSSLLDQPYRQRIYQITQNAEGTIESKVFQLPYPEKYIQAWKNPTLFNDLNPRLLREREGCSVFINKKDNGCYEGQTRNKSCKSKLRGASYATSIVKICEGSIMSWDQGWSAFDEQVWGAEKGGYLFIRKY